jgi:hypothetical protein
MISVFLAIIFGLFAAFAQKLPILNSGEPNPSNGKRFLFQRFILPIRLVFGFIAMFCVFSTSYVNIDENSAGHKVKTYGYSNLTPGKVIATNAEKGPQGDVIQPGFHISPLLNVINKVESLPILVPHKVSFDE